MHFHDFQFCYDIQDSLDDMGFETPTPIQEQAIPAILEGKDLIGCAQTGTGKTAAFLLPILDKLAREPRDVTDTLIIVPTRELALQIDQALLGFAYHSSVSSAVIYGGGDGMDFEREKAAMAQGANILIATPGRLISHLNMGNIKADGLRHLVLDEADRMLNMGFIDDILKIIEVLPKERQTLMFSATMPPKIRSLAQKLLTNPVEISLAVSKPAEKVIQNAYMVHNYQKNALIEHILAGRDKQSIIIFAGTRQKVKELERDLRRAKLHVNAIHSDLEQSEREDVMRKFRNKTVPVLVATDILSRGIDVDDISLVINYDVPKDAEDYIHRIGRTARAESDGAAITLINEVDQNKFLQIEKLMESTVEKLDLPAGFETGPKYAPKDRPPNGQFKKKKFFHKGKKGK